MISAVKFVVKTPSAAIALLLSVLILPSKTPSALVALVTSVAKSVVKTPSAVVALVISAVKFVVKTPSAAIALTASASIAACKSASAAIALVISAAKSAAKSDDCELNVATTSLIAETKLPFAVVVKELKEPSTPVALVTSELICDCNEFKSATNPKILFLCLCKTAILLLLRI